MNIDHLGPFVKSKRQNAYIIGISDPFSKFIIIKAVRDTKTKPVITFLNEMTSFFGLPMKIITDRGTTYTSTMFENYCDQNNIVHVKTAVRTPRANG